MSQSTAPILVIGRYALFDELARGGMATVHFGRLLGPAGFSRTVAIKRLHPHLASDPSFVAMLLDEARLAGRIQHPNVAATIDVVAKDGELFVVMEYLHGESLARLSRVARSRNEAVPVNVAVAVVSAALHGLHAAHEVRGESGEPLGIVHRDVSPQNVMVRRDGSSAVVDFGVAKAAGRFQTTEDGQIKGKLPYMAPEQVRGQPVSRRVDIYAAAAVLWETLVGKRLFAGANEGEVLEQLLFSTLSPPSAHVPGIPPALDAIVLRGLERDPQKRFATAREMALALEDALAPALPSRVSAWVDSLVGDSLDERATRVAAVETGTFEARTSELEALVGSQSGRRAPADPPAAVPLPDPASTVSTAFNLPDVPSLPKALPAPPAPGAPPAPAAFRPRAVGIAVAAAMLLSGVWFLLGRAGAPTLAARAEPSSAPSLAPSPSPSPSPSLAPSGEAPAAGASAGLSPDPPLPPAASAAPPASAPKGAPPRASRRPAVDCSVPYVIDASGKKTYKRECL